MTCTGNFFVVVVVVEDGQRKKRSTSNPSKLINLELIIKSGTGGQETKLTLIPASSYPRKTSVEWLKALKKVKCD